MVAGNNFLKNTAQMFDFILKFSISGGIIAGGQEVKP